MLQASPQLVWHSLFAFPRLVHCAAADHTTRIIGANLPAAEHGQPFMRMKLLQYLGPQGLKKFDDIRTSKTLEGEIMLLRNDTTIRHLQTNVENMDRECHARAVEIQASVAQNQALPGSINSAQQTHTHAADTPLSPCGHCL